MVQRNGEKTYYCHEAFAKHCHIESQKGKFSKRYKTFWKSRSYYLEHYSGFNKFQLIIIGLSNFAYHWMKLLFYHLKEAIWNERSVTYLSSRLIAERHFVFLYGADVHTDNCTWGNGNKPRKSWSNGIFLSNSLLSAHSLEKGYDRILLGYCLLDGSIMLQSYFFKCSIVG